MARGRKPEITYDELVDGIFNAMELLQIKYMPTCKQLSDIPEIEVGDRKVPGKVIYNRMHNIGHQEVREDLMLKSKKEYEGMVVNRVLNKRSVL